MLLEKDRERHGAFFFLRKKQRSGEEGPPGVSPDGCR
jgi:hypothetical protein